MSNDLLMIKNLDNWNEVTRGLYRFVISAGCCYEIHILYHADTTPILTAKANAYIVGSWTSSNDSNEDYFSREQLFDSPKTVQECLSKVFEDFESCVEESDCI